MRYATFSFSGKANLDEGAMWPIAFALTQMLTAVKARIGAGGESRELEGARPCEILWHNDQVSTVLSWYSAKTPVIKALSRLSQC